MIRLLYSLILYLSIPAVLLKMKLRARKAPAYNHRWKERFGIIKPLPDSRPVIWIHSVSVGETIASAPMVKEMMKRYPEHQFVVTTMTPTGSDRVKALYGDSVYHVYCPYDLPDALNRFLNAIHPELALMMETELWPNTLAACRKRGIPVLIANARLSEKSARGYGKLGALTRNMMKDITLVACQNVDDGERFKKLGLPADRLKVTGSVKFDISVSPEVLEEANSLRASWEAGLCRKAKLLIAASTHDGEDQPVIDAFKQVLNSYDEAVLVLVPRHPERFNSVCGLIQKNQLTVIRHSETTETQPNTRVILGDTMGELVKLYATSDIAFVGGSLVENGGHNMLEPAALGKPVITGPSCFNFLDISQQLQQVCGMKVINSSEQLADEVKRIFANDELSARMGEAGRTFVEQNRGAMARMLDLVAGLIK